MRRLLLFALATGALLAQPASDFATKADAYVQSWARDGKFRGAVLLAKDGKAVFRKAYGNANDEWDIANTPDTKFRLGSITKQFTAVAILRLVDQGKVKLDDPVKTFYAGAPPAWDKITVHHLLNHTSGIPSYTNQPDFMAKNSRNPLTPVEIVKLTQDLPLHFEPGAGYRYNNTGYILLGVILEIVTAQPYAAYIKSQFFDPLGMKDSGYDVSAEVLKKRAAGYQANGKQAPYLDMTLPYAAGSFYSTVDDLVKWDEALQSGRLLSRESWRKMTTAGRSDYGYGLAMRPLDGRAAQSHGGGINGFNAFMIRVPGERLVLIALANQNTQATDAIATNLAKIYLGTDIPLHAGKAEIRLPAETLDRYAGQYELRAGFVLKVWRVG